MSGEWRRKHDQELTTADIAEMRRSAELWETVKPPPGFAPQWGDRPPPLPERVELAGTVREVGRTELPVAEVTFVDVIGEQRVLHLSPRVLMSLVSQAVRFLEQVGGFDG